MANDAASPAPDDARLLDQLVQRSEALRARLAERIVGQDEVVTMLLAAVLAEGHTLLVGVPGLAKTLLVKTLAEALGVSFARVQFTPDLMPADLIGTELLETDDAGRRHLQFHPGPIFTQLLLADEINRTPPKTQAALLEAMQERQVTSMGQRHELAPPFLVVATQNPIEQEGTYPLPEAQLDRFMLSLTLDYPSEDEERRIVAQATDASRERTEASHPYPSEPIVTLEALRAGQALARRVPVAPSVVNLAVALARATRPSEAEPGSFVREHVAWGAGPRAGQHLVQMGQALALLDGRPAVGPDHLRRAAAAVLSHRVVPSYAALGEGISARQIVEHVLENRPT
jgi:MoxR-like ATPase